MSGIKKAAGVDSIYAFDVVNEAISYNGTAWTHREQPANANAWYSRMHDYIEKAFTYERASDPNAKLFYNDFMMERSPGKNTAILNLVQDWGLFFSSGSKQLLIILVLRIV